MSGFFWEPAQPRTPAVLRMLVILAALCAGYITARHAPGIPSAAWLAAAAGFCALAAAGRSTWTRAMLALAIVALAGGWFTIRMYEPPRGSLVRIIAPEDRHPGMVISVRGQLTSPPRIQPSQRDVLNPYARRAKRTWFDLELESLETRSGPLPVRGSLSVRIGETAHPSDIRLGGELTTPRQGDGPILRAGDRVRITGLFHPVAAPVNPGEPDRRLWAAQDGRAGILRLPSHDLIEPLPPQGGLSRTLRAAWLFTRGTLIDRTHHLLLGPRGEHPAPHRALLGALILGEQEPALREVRSAFTRLGLAHILCISGFHLAMLAAVGMFALRLTGDIGRWESILMAALLAVYLVVLPFQAPVWRAAMMVLALLLASALGRRYDRLVVLMWIAIAMLIWRPMDLWAIGFQLSFGLVGMLIWLSHPLHQRIWGFRILGTVHPDPGPGGAILEWFKQLFTANLLCWGVASPLIAYHTGLVSPLAVLAGIVAVPVVMLVLIGGYAVVLLNALSSAAAGIARIATEHLAAFASTIVTWMDALPGSSVRIPSLSIAWTIAATLLAIYWFARGHRRDRLAWGASLAVAAWLGVEVWTGSTLPRHVALRLDALAVGDGTCMLIRSGNESLLWDCGSLTPGIGQVLVPRTLRALGAWEVPTVIITHPHLDHFNALLDIAGPLRVRTVILGERFIDRAAARPGGPEACIMEGLQHRGIEVRTIAAGAQLSLGSASFEFISPPPGATWPGENDQSLAALVRIRTDTQGADRTLLLTGDMQEDALTHVMTSRPLLRADIMEAPHHGSAREPAFEFVWRTNPVVVIQSTGASRVGDERWESVRAGRRWHKTARDGASWVEVWRSGAIRSGAYAPSH